MALSKKGICDFGWKARDFALKGVDSKTYRLADVRGPKGTLVVFICNHCPYVKASIGRIVAEAGPCAISESAQSRSCRTIPGLTERIRSKT